MDFPHILARRYRLDRRVGAGSDADTYLATDLALDRPVAVNVLPAPMAGDPAGAARFDREVRAAAIDHPHVVRVLDAGTDGATRFIVMEAVLGSSLTARVAVGAPLSFDQALEWTSQILDGLAAIHDAGLIHGDLTPENVLIDAHGRVKLTTFGITHCAPGVGRTETGRTGGSAPDLAPEQVRGEPLTPADDIYAVGIILFELLTGQLPFIADHPLGVRYQQVHQRPPSVRAINPAVPAVLDGVVATALAQDPRQRYPSARAMQGMLVAVAAAQEIQVPPAISQESPRWTAARRGTLRFLVTAAAVVLLLLTSLVVLTFRRTEPGADLAAGPALASSQLVDPQPHRSALTPATPTPTATAENLVPPPIHRIVPVVPVPTAPPHAAAHTTATVVPTPTPAPRPGPSVVRSQTRLPKPTPTIVRSPTRAPRPTPTAEPSPATAPSVAPASIPQGAPTPPPSPHQHTGARRQPSPPPPAPPGKATGHHDSPPPPKLPGMANHHDSSPPSIQSNRRDGHGHGGSHGGKKGHAPRGG